MQARMRRLPPARTAEFLDNRLRLRVDRDSKSHLSENGAKNGVATTGLVPFSTWQFHLRAHGRRQTRQAAGVGGYKKGFLLRSGGGYRLLMEKPMSRQDVFYIGHTALRPPLLENYYLDKVPGFCLLRQRWP